MEEVLSSLRTCSKCGEEKEKSEFKISGGRTCKKCDASLSRKWYMENKEHRQKSDKERRQTPHGRAISLLASMRFNCKRLGLPPPEFTTYDIEKRITQGSCDKTGIPFDLTNYASAISNPFSPSPDRIIPSEGYTRTNVQWVCWIYNVMKSDFPAEVVEKFIAALVTKHQSQVTQ